MRNSHQKSRSRGRNRKPQNPLSRNYESNGPDVKIRGNAGHIAEKYSSLARDALSNGDTVMAENYLQHAEHYNRIIAVAQAQKAEEAAARAEEAENAEAAAASEDKAAESTGEAAVEAGAEENEKPRRNGRGRKPQQSNGSKDAEPAAEKPASEASSEEASESVSVEAISEDASKLPESLRSGFLSDDA